MDDWITTLGKFHYVEVAQIQYTCYRVSAAQNVVVSLAVHTKKKLRFKPMPVGFD